jgi:hypothetical protein
VKKVLNRDEIAKSRTRDEETSGHNVAKSLKATLGRNVKIFKGKMDDTSRQNELMDKMSYG